MAKRKLNRRQQWRIQKIQDERLARANKKQKNFNNDDELLDQVHHHGVVVSHFGATLDIEDDSSHLLVRCALRQNIDAIVCGDKIVWQKLTNIAKNVQIQGVVTALDARSTVLARPDFTGQMKPVAANIDQLLIVTSPVPELNEGLIDRYIVAAELSHIQPIIVLNKIDTLSHEQRQVLEKRIKIYQDIKYQILYTSAKSQHGLDTLLEQLTGKVSVFVGQSGVGKSSIINALLPNANIKEGEVSLATNKGTHTTSVSRLYHINTPSQTQSSEVQTSLIDSPGVREFGLWDISREDVIHGFVELQQYIQHCHFRDCKHLNEPNCGLLKAIEENKISEQRLNSYHRIIDSIDS
ncbi:MAG: small ribosomal subunit biogenesis GTPase RsgA [gamma proteobacterium symbiont of Bathyaustriella thionipta]|nr:small ribosomal subunit biogenesis GTPase RsgA [gamma proteobacterium symbiont of Bathyaustriella thionipta]MCU7949954.1 small ribosomal subunit biogenesis GTPase RsgA [gamma proteobacterium symbiont of Bathyaustriella thionipta]MCU7954696.1 small ribosomal subunit biogenesis GTPase RsgA [gamma proteobacterium symbiont of Bathyaustriella thionipta]MCU7956519.1 small ribosomal subunit biogenesis GTPase RsgA [gamma proteobacterium symbiont of Bathyaustriella thionipta]MCU7966833.1 small riboso